ncbi:MAG: SDR family oxidoreductase [Myxococcota bacterium]
MAEQKRVGIITGATSGIGASCVRRLVGAGFGIVGLGRRKDRLDALEADLGGGFRGVAGDATEADTLERLFSAAEEHFSMPANLVVVNAGRGLGGSVATADLSEVHSLIELNVTGALRLMQAAAQRFTPRAEREFPNAAYDIVVIGSVVGRSISPFSAVYGATKFAVHSMAEALRRELASKGVRVTLVEPGYVRTEFHQAGGYSDETIETLNERFGPPLDGDDIASAIHHLVSLPPHVHMSDVVVRPTRQDYP